jgi:hypothetical protein
MVVEFQPTLEELNESRAAHLQTSDAAAVERLRGGPSVILMMLLLTLAIGGSFLAAYAVRHFGLTPGVRALLYVSVLCTYALPVYAAVEKFRARRQTQAPPVEQVITPAPAYVATAMSAQTTSPRWIVFCVVAAGVMLGLPGGSPAARTVLRSGTVLLFACAAIGIAITVARQRRQIIRNLSIETNAPLLERRTRLEFDDPATAAAAAAAAGAGGFTTVVGDARYHHPWPSILRFVETPNLFLLYLSPQDYVFFPKRALPTPAHVDALRQTLRHNITRPTRGFPVAPASAGTAQPIVKGHADA